MKEFQFNDIYSLVSLIDRSVRFEESFWNYDQVHFIRASTKFSKKTLLHLYITSTAYNYHHRDFRKNGDCFEEDESAHWQSLFDSYEIKIPALNLDNKEEPVCWLKNNQNAFLTLFERMSNEAFHILFPNRNFLLNFNKLVSEEISNIAYPPESLTQKGTIKRMAIPKWAQNAVYHRDKGRCIYCNADLTGIVNILTLKNFDHIVPLDLHGSNDPCNIQLTCEKCNKKKSNKEISTSFKYQPWWPN